MEGRAEIRVSIRAEVLELFLGRSNFQISETDYLFGFEFGNRKNYSVSKSETDILPVSKLETQIIDF